MKKAMTIQDLAELRDILANCTDSQYECVKAYAYALAHNSTDDIEFNSPHIKQNWSRISLAPKEFHLGLIYRIKPQPKLIPFGYIDADELAGRWIMRAKMTGYKSRHLISQINSDGIVIDGNNSISWQVLFSSFVFLNGSPCGKESK